MTTPPPLDPMTMFFLGGIRMAALVEFMELSGLQPDVFAACLDRAADAARRRTLPEAEAEILQRAALVAEEEARQIRMSRART